MTSVDDRVGCVAPEGPSRPRGSAGDAPDSPRTPRLRARVLKRWVLPVIVYTLLRVLRWTWRCRETGRAHLEEALASGRSPVAAFLHGRSFMLLPLMHGRRNGRWLSMCSQSLDGDAMAKIEQWMGFEVIRGSTGRGGLDAIITMIRTVRDRPGLGACLAIDGSRGPRGRVQGGVISLAQRTGGIILPITVSARPATIFRGAWDRTLLAWPFARVELVFGELISVPAKLKAAEFEDLRAELEDRLVALQDQADERSGFRDVEPVRASVG